MEERHEGHGADRIPGEQYWCRLFGHTRHVSRLISAAVTSTRVCRRNQVAAPTPCLLTLNGKPSENSLTRTELFAEHAEDADGEPHQIFQPESNLRCSLLARITQTMMTGRNYATI